nr:MAG TPA: hypothetical protein [Caudoviricetes sp.]
MSKFVRRYLVRFLRYNRCMRLEALKINMIYDSLDRLLTLK